VDHGPGAGKLTRRSAQSSEQRVFNAMRNPEPGRPDLGMRLVRRVFKGKNTDCYLNQMRAAMTASAAISQIATDRKPLPSVPSPDARSPLSGIL